MRNLGIVVLGAALAGCASSSADITPTYVSLMLFQSYNCQPATRPTARQRPRFQLSGVDRTWLWLVWTSERDRKLT
jgi:hypothetical protein